MTDFSCPDCKDTGLYQGLFAVEPCRACGGKKRQEIPPLKPLDLKVSKLYGQFLYTPEMVQDWELCRKVSEEAFKVLREQTIADVCQQFAIPPEVFSGQSIRHELEEQITEKPFDEICPAELEGLAIGGTVSVSIECKDWMRAFEVMDRLIDRPIFGLPRQSFRFKRVGLSAPDIDGKCGITATLLYKPLGKDDWWTVKDRHGNTIQTQCLYQSDPCQDMLFILED